MFLLINNLTHLSVTAKKSQHTTSSPTAQPQGSTEVQRTTTGWLKHGRTTVYLTTRGVNVHSLESSINVSSAPSNQPLSSNEPKMDSLDFLWALVQPQAHFSPLVVSEQIFHIRWRDRDEEHQRVQHVKNCMPQILNIFKTYCMQ